MAINGQLINVSKNKRYMLACARMAIDRKLVELGSTGAHRKGSIVVSCRSRSNQSLGHPCTNCSNWEPRSPGGDCPSCGIHLSWYYFELLETHDDVRGGAKEDSAYGRCPGCGPMLNALNTEDTVDRVIGH